MKARESKQILQSFFEAGNRGDMQACMALIADDITWRNMGTSSLSGTYRGKDELNEKLLGPLFSRLMSGIHMDVKYLVAEGDLVVAVTSGRAETQEGVPYNNEYCWVVRVRDGQMAELTEFMDTELAKRVFG